MNWLTEIKARLAAATAGPWIVDATLINDIDGKEIGEANRIDNNGLPSDAIFIANAPTDIAALIAAVEKKDEALKEISEIKIHRAINIDQLGNSLITIAEDGPGSQIAREALAFDPTKKEEK